MDVRKLSHIAKTPVVGERLVYVNCGMAIPCEVVSVTTVCRVKLLAGGINNQLEGRVIPASLGILRKV
jgi:hypothetical protein